MPTPQRADRPGGILDLGASATFRVQLVWNMQIEWDEEKRQENIRKHGLDFVGAEAIFDGDTLTIEDTRRDYGERRWITVGTFEGRLVVLVHTERGDVIRPISLRKATRYERRTYFSQISH